jgi:hypothetical protein
MNNKTGCLICGIPLEYLQEEISSICNLCGITSTTLVTCEDGHYVCDNCHRLEANDWIEQVSSNSLITNPFDLAIQLMEHPSIKMHGPEHHFIVPAALLSSYHNLKGLESKKQKAIAQARQRSEKLPGGFCGFCGNCGAAVGTGIFVSVILEANPLSTKSWSLCNRMTALSLGRVADYGGPRCCKRDTFLTIKTALTFAETNLDFNFGQLKAPICTFSNMNKECLKNDCPFYGQMT